MDLQDEAPAIHFACEALGHTFMGERGHVQALSGLNLEIRQHEFVCVVGPSGCGKSTLVRIVAGLQEPSSGKIYWPASDTDTHSTARTPSRKPSRTQPGNQTRRHGGLVVQEHGTFPWMSAIDNVAFGLELSGVAPPVRSARALAYLERVGLSQFANHYPHELSVGMRQRLGIGRAFVIDAPLLLMDEPFGALDAQTRRQMQHELLNIWVSDRRTVLFVTHDIEEAVLLGDRVVVMSGRPGHVIADIPINLSRPRSAQNFDAAAAGIIDRIWQLLECPAKADA